MILRLSAALAAATMLLAACGSDAPQPAAYQAGQSESRQPQAQAERVPERVRDGEDAEQPEAERVPERVRDLEEAMVGRVIESGHRAGLFADRASIGAPDAPIVITEYSDFL